MHIHRYRWGLRHSGQQPKFTSSNVPTKIGERMYSGHALDQMRAREIKPTVVENTIKKGVRNEENSTGTARYYDAKNNMSVVVDNATNKVITVYFGNVK